ncbi:MAG TPA: HEAT repeat domain-containing protein [Candidatus Eisenbacteria bacterium]|nr:HEAT repeat domain-containing protein [Candidatus Eisenbacteria bacterium]
MAVGDVLAGASRRLGLEPREVGTLALMGALISVLFCGYTIAKVLRDALFIVEFGALALPYAYVAVAVGSAAFVWLESEIVRRYTRVDPMHFNQLLAILIGTGLAFAYPLARHWTAAALYVWTGSQVLLLLSHFWVLALDVWDSRKARSVFPVLSGFGLLGGLLGGGLAASLTSVVRREGLIWLLTILLIAAQLLTRIIELRHRRRPRLAEAQSAISRWGIVRRSKYIKIFVAGLALSVIVSTLVDFQFKYFIQRLYPNPHRLAEFLGMFYVGLNTLALIFQFGFAGWLLHRLGLGASTGLQPTTVLAFAIWMILGSGAWIIVAMRWVQGVVFQTLGKASGEIYYAAIRPSERRRIKPAIDTLVERWSDAAVGVLLLFILHALRLPMPAIAIATAVLAALWLVVLLRLDRQYGQAFEVALSKRWIEPEEAAEIMRIPSARRAGLDALRSPDERRVVVALQLLQRVRDRASIAAVRECLRRPSPAVRAAAIQALEVLGVRDPENEIEPLLGDSNEAVRRAAVSYRLTRGRHPVDAARTLLSGDDVTMCRYVLEVMLDHPQVGVALTAPRVESWRASSRADIRQLAALAIGALPSRAPVDAMRALLADPDLEVRRSALQSMARRPIRQLLDAVLPMLLDENLGHEARQAVAAIGSSAVRALQDWLQGLHGPAGQSVAARTLALMGNRRAIDALIPLTRHRDVWLRHLAFHALVKIRVDLGRPVLSRGAAHRLFLQELADYRLCLQPARALSTYEAPEVKLLAQSCEESASMALERGLQALACWYEARPMLGALERLRSRDPDAIAPALEYLSHRLPRRLFRPLSQAFERPAEKEGAKEIDHPLGHWIRMAWDSEDAWLRACAVRASRHDPTFDLRTLPLEDDAPEIVRGEIARVLTLAAPSRTAAAGRSPVAC